MTQKERLVELLDSSCCPQKDDYYRYEDYLDALAEYLVYHGVIVPPCKVGDKVWLVVFSDKEIIDGYVEEISYKWVCQQETVIVSMQMNTKRGCLTYWRDFYDFGDHVFLSKAEAEQALKERDGK